MRSEDDYLCKSCDIFTLYYTTEHYTLITPPSL